MSELTLLIPAKYEKEALPVFLDEIKNYNYKKKIFWVFDPGWEKKNFSLEKKFSLRKKNFFIRKKKIYLKEKKIFP